MTGAPCQLLLFLARRHSWRELLIIPSLAGASDKPANEMTGIRKPPEASHNSFIDIVFVRCACLTVHSAF
jgi:hypothetical protein